MKPLLLRIIVSSLILGTMIKKQLTQIRSDRLIAQGKKCR